MKIGVLGGTGRMGRLVVQKILETPSFQLSAVSVHHQKFKDSSLENTRVMPRSEEVFPHSEVVIDFTTPDALQGHLESAITSKTPMVIGTTGLTEAHHALLQEAGTHIPLVYDVNMSLGITLMMRLVEHAASVLDAHFDIEILEMHHRHKTDAPSGTALALGQAAAKGREVSFDETVCCDRTQRTSPRPDHEIGFAVLRGGNVPGDHQVIFASGEEVLTLSHRALNRDVFARGAVQAARWLKDKTPGVYHMKDVLGL